MLFKSIVNAAVLATAMASPLQHQHHQHEKKDVITKYVTVEAAGAGAATSTSTSAAVGTGSASAAGAAGTGSTSTSSTSTSTSTSSGTWGGYGKGISYSPYTAAGGCKSEDTVKSEVAALSEYEIIRIYGVDCSQVEYVLAGMSSDQKLFAGIYDMTAISEGVATLASAVEAANGWDQVYTVSIGNELVNSGSATVSQIESYVSEGRAALEAAGYTGSVVSVDTFIAVINNPGLCDYSDYIAVNAHAFFDGGVTAANAGTWVLEQIERVYSACGSSKSVFITESGWPTQGDANGECVPGTTEQKAALEDISDKCGNDVIFFNAYNDLWKADGEYNCEKYWGIYSS